ncbi:hypothetical protein DPMN_189386 [Dreissena polymorpha]|uniref:Chromo domain-containing protein n=1 Tax=Dreissena polymorpha TaxID=45954 RepID=A0A9D4IAS2_DREPO|nr:hypothetical protein DPMN_189386 [Dreissena polymorpha]
MSTIWSPSLQLTECGVRYYLVRWRDLDYDMATWEPEDSEVPEFKSHVDYYDNLRQGMLVGPVEEKPHSKKKGKKKDDDYVNSPRPLGMPPAYPISDAHVGEYVWAKMKGAEVLWPVQILAVDVKVKVYIKCDDAESFDKEKEIHHSTKLERRHQIYSE